jgi:hypothetical protein
MRWVLGRKRDAGGRLLRAGSKGGLPPWVAATTDANGMRVITGGRPMSFAAMMRQRWRKAGLDPQQVKERWREYLADNPGARKGERTWG